VDSEKHVAIGRKLCLVAHRLAMTGDHDCSAGRGREICLGSFEHPFDVSAGRVIDERIDAIPVRIASMKNIRVQDGDGYIAVRMRGTVIFEGKCGAIQVQSLLR